VQYLTAASLMSNIALQGDSMNVAICS